MLSKKRNYAAVVALKATWYNAEGILLRGDDAKESSCEPPEDHGTTNVISQNNSSDIVTHSASHKIVSENNTSPNSQSAPSDTIKCAGGDKKDEVSELGSVSGSPPVIERTIENKIEHLNNAKPDGSDMVSLASGVSRTEVMSRVSTEFTETTCPSMKGLTKETYSEYIRKYGKISDVESVCTDDTRHQMDQFMLEDLEINDETPSYDGESLFVATEMCDAQAVRRILNLPHIDINAVDKNGKTVLHIASEQGFDEIVKTILSHVDLLTTAHLSKKDQNGQTALQLACGQNHFKVAQLLLQHPAQFINVNECLLTFSSHDDIAHLLRDRADQMTLANEGNAKESSGEPEASGGIPEARPVDALSVNRAASMYAASVCGAKPGSDVESVSTNNSQRQRDMFMTEDIDSINASSYEGDSLLIATENFDAQAVGRILNHRETDVNAVDEHGNTALHIASEQGLQEVVQQILSHASLDVNKQTKNAKQSALEVACGRNHPIVVQLLLGHGNIDGENVNYCLFLSSYFGPPDVVDLLLQHSEININSDFSKLKD
eukprot:gene121-71_t